jgi:hypothetical protein
VQQRRRAEIEKEQTRIAAYHEQAAKAEEDRINRWERERRTSLLNRGSKFGT